MDTRINKHLIGLLLVSSVALTACSSHQNAPNSDATARTIVTAEALEQSFKRNVLAHREQGAIATQSFEAQVRHAVRDHLNLDFTYLASADKEQLTADLLQTDARLSEFVHASNRGSNLDQLWALLPALPALERRKALKIALTSQFDEAPELANERMAELMDLQLNRLFGDFTISLDALTPETEEFEGMLVAGLKSEGFNISARRPSLILEYFIDAYDNEGDIEVIADFELKDRNAQTFHTVSNMTTYKANKEGNAEQKAFDFLASDIAEQLLDKALTRINAVNQVK
ncbi:hypothetical protein [Marinomonas gallaica]|uniref:hypothetical protein n=1 Tax=Marinomonas gallaica TaxID=1806667 RepID=UPI00083374C4|nr:hypothetical protein [Marinomonas gallaica]